ncbi:hypothetical protein HX850_02845 [Marine Group I thaumarchaeote]|uniref:Uncharacterized protein n=1 Tax=Marine Group I thaumarchaeote TaxID=2511932 RepID=A0A7K4MKV7_9ARCH|nr:hypothetical protein [Marine Group I thaumarchaeote]
MIDPDKKDEKDKNDKLHKIELKCVALGQIPSNLFRDNDNQYVSVEKAVEIMRTVEKKGEEIHEMARSFREKYEFSKE